MSEAPRYEYKPPTFSTEPQPQAQPGFRGTARQAGREYSPEQFAEMRRRAQLKGFDLELDPFTGEPHRVDGDALLNTYSSTTQPGGEQVEQSTYKMLTDDGEVVVRRTQRRIQIVEEEHAAQGVVSPEARERVAIAFGGAQVGIQAYSEVPTTSRGYTHNQHEELGQRESNPALEQGYRDEAARMAYTHRPDPTEVMPPVGPQTLAVPARDDTVEGQIIGSLSKRTERKLKRAEKHERKSGKLGIIRGVGVLAVSSVIGFSAGWHGVTGEMPTPLSVIKTAPAAVMDLFV